MLIKETELLFWTYLLVFQKQVVPVPVVPVSTFKGIWDIMSALFNIWTKES